MNEFSQEATQFQEKQFEAVFLRNPALVFLLDIKEQACFYSQVISRY